MLDSKDSKKKSSRGIASENPLTSASRRAVNPISSVRPHASAPSATAAVSLRQGDTLWEVAQKKLGNGDRWGELRKADGSRFTSQEAKRLSVGTKVYLPGVKPTQQTNDSVTSLSQTSKGNTQFHRSNGIKPRVLTSSFASPNRNSQFSTTPALFSRTSQVSFNLSKSSKDKTPNQSFNTANNQGRNKQSADSSSTLNNPLINGTVKGIAMRAFPMSRGTPRKIPHTTSLDTNRAIGNMTEKAWNEHLNSRSDVVKNIRQTTWKDRNTKKTMPFPDAKSRRPDNFLKLKNGQGVAVEIKGTPLAAQSREAQKQRARDKVALSKRALLGNKKRGFQEVDRAITKVGLPILGPGGNTALPGEKQKHVIIKPKSGAKALPSTWSEHVKSLGGYKDSPKASKATKGILRTTKTVGTSGVTKGVLRGASRIAAPVAVGLDAWQLKNAYQKDGFGKEFRKTAGSVAGAWGGAAAGAAIGSAIFPGVGTVVGGVIGGVAGSEWGDDIEQGAEKAGKAIAGGAKKAWNKIFG
ncbi:MAG: hypothetical protein RMY34_03880 [Aulosira sp. DedQUE10]|nr:hypothetical protein [Aulosira sp. DedQUE10]